MLAVSPFFELLVELIAAISRIFRALRFWNFIEMESEPGRAVKGWPFAGFLNLMLAWMFPFGETPLASSVTLPWISPMLHCTTVPEVLKPSLSGIVPFRVNESLLKALGNFRRAWICFTCRSAGLGPQR